MQVGLLGTSPRSVAEDALGLLAFSVIPDGTASALQINRSDTGQDVGVTLGQLGAGFTVSKEMPLYLEGYLGYARYDPRFVFSDGEEARQVPTRWNQISVTVGAGWDIALSDRLYLRPIVNAAGAHVTTDLALAGALVNLRRERDFDFLSRGRLNAWGLGGSLVLAWYDHRPQREVDVELRGTRLHLATFDDTSVAIRSTMEATTVSLWARLRVPTGYEAFGRPVRWVLEAQHSHFIGAQRSALGFEFLTKLGAGLELDLGKLEVGAFGLTAQRLRWVGRYVFGENVSGFSVGLGLSF
ncbi:autotransporter domain-containing protein [Dankookia rubra]|nr:autotransporter domain-containing protein [Dankookia rubra]